MTKKHFVALADMIRLHNKYSTVPFTETQIMALADFCKEQNPEFNRERWLSYIKGKSGPNGGPRKVQLATDVKHVID